GQNRAAESAGGLLVGKAFQALAKAGHADHAGSDEKIRTHSQGCSIRSGGSASGNQHQIEARIRAKNIDLRKHHFHRSIHGTHNIRVPAIQCADDIVSENAVRVEVIADKVEKFLRVQML